MTGAGRHLEGSTATLTAIPASDYEVDAWSGACASASGTSCDVKMSGPRSAGVTFKAKPPPPPIYHELKATAGANGRVTGAGRHLEGSTATLTAIPASDYEVDAWSGACASASGTSCDVKMSGPRSAGVTFKLRECTQVVKADPAAGAKSLGGDGGSYKCGNGSPTPSQEAAACHAFTGWTYSTSGRTRTATAKYTKDTSSYTLTVKSSPAAAASTVTSKHPCGKEVTPAHPAAKTCWLAKGTLASITITGPTTVTALYDHNEKCRTR